VDDDGDLAVDCLDTECYAQPVCGLLRINEVDYDQPGTDTTEFVEIFNAGARDTVLTGVDLVLINGDTGLPLITIPLTGTVAVGGYVLVAAPAVTAPGGVPVIPFGPGTESFMQNGPDGVALWDNNSNTLVDALSYEGPITAAVLGGGTVSLVRGTAVVAQDSGAPVVSLIRAPNGQATGDDNADWRATRTLTPGASNVLTEVCDNTLDDDGDTLVDCLDPDCSDTLECPEVCNNGVDDDADTFTDCAEPSCDAQTCGPNGLTCAASMCMCPGGAVETACTGGGDEDCDGSVDCADTDCATAPACTVLGITSVNYPVITQGGTLIISGAGFTGATGVTLGSVSQTFTVDSDTGITITAVGDGTPLGPQSLVVTTPGGSTPPFSVTVINLVINEVDSDTPGTDAAEFIEISTQVPGVSLAGYTLVFWNGSNDLSYFAVELNAVTNAFGLLLVGNVGVTPVIIFADNFLQNGPDAVAIYQAPAVAFPNNTAVTAAGLIDAVVYDTADADDAGLLDVLLGPVPSVGRVQVDENANAAQATDSVQRCGLGRRRGDKFGVGAATPGGPPSIPVCP